MTRVSDRLAQGYREHVVPRVVEKACGSTAMRPMRDQAAAGLSGVVVELGFGSGHSLESYPPEVTLVHAVEPSELGRRLGRERIDTAAVPVHFVDLDGTRIDLPDRSCDAALSTFTLCTVPDVEQALAELRRVLVPGAPFHFAEHGLAPEANVQRWQRRIEPVHKALADGCHLTREPEEMVRAAGFEVELVERAYAKGPKPWVYFTVGRARNPG